MITPSFSLNFLTGTLDPRITFTRASATATCVNASGNIEVVAADTPRFDYNPVTLALKGLLVEAGTTNLVLQSQNFGTTWARTNTTVTSGAVSPDGVTNSDRIVETAISGAHLVLQSGINLTIGQTYRFSVYVKSAERSWIAMQFSTGFTGTPGTYFNSANGTIGTTFSGSPVPRIANAGNGWYRCSIQAVAAATTGTIVIYLASGNGTVVYLGDVNNGINLWGAQVELGTLETSYIPTTTTAVVRNADVATITGTNFSDFWQASKGGAQVQAIPSTVSGIRPLVQYDDGTADNIIALRGNAANPELQIVASGTPQVQLDAGTIAANTAYSLTGWWQTNDCKARQNAGAVVTDTTATIPTVTQAKLGSDGTNYLNGHLATINYYDSFFGQPIYTRRKNKVFSSLL
jgi:hypothetical protein